MMTPVPADGPLYDDLEPGMVLEPQPAVTLDSGLAAWYQSIVGEVLPLTLDHRLSAAVSGRDAPLASPGLVVNLSIGQSTVATRRAIANLFYRNLRLRRPVHLGETLHTVVTIEAMADATPRPDRPNRGKILLGIRTTADDDVVIDYQRCALLPARGDEMPGYDDDTGSAPAAIDLATYADLAPANWDPSAAPTTGAWAVGERRGDVTRDVIDEATGLVRLTHNRAIVHRDVGASTYDTRLVYGGHVVALAQASLTRLEPRLASILAWHACSHLGPAFEGDLLSFEHEVVAEVDLDTGLGLRAYETTAVAERDDRPSILSWTPVCLTVT